jgi:translocation and assembly module TamA
MNHYFFCNLILSIFFLLNTTILTAVCSYQVQFKGTDNASILSDLQNSSQAVQLQDSPPETAAGLRRRVDADALRLVKALQSLAYYHAKVHHTMDFSNPPFMVTFTIELGPVYPLTAFHVKSTSKDTPRFSLAELGITLGNPAYPKIILGAEEILVQKMGRQGYPLAKITHKDVVADQSLKSITATLYLDPGPKALFGKTTIEGLHSVDEDFLRGKIEWMKGNIYDPALVEKTLLAIETTGLFSSIAITHAEQASADGSLPMTIQVVERKHRSVGLGLSYGTQLGPGFAAEWEHRNIRGMGEKLGFKANVSQRLKEGSLLYVKPDFYRKNQDLQWLADICDEETEGFSETSYSLSATIERQMNDRMKLSYGTMVKSISTSHSDNNRHYTLIKFPFQYRWSNTNDLLDPTQGQSINIKSVPTFQVLKPSFGYTVNTLTTTFYHPLDEDEHFVLAGKASLGTILGSSRHEIPPSERFYAGTENTLRGYRYMTVSPLNDKHKPIGGRSLMVFTGELRYRSSEKLGLVGFYEIGNVYSSIYPQLQEKQLQSVGIGLRYQTPVGPLRLDFAVPLNRRRHVDEAFQFYFSIGQAF